MEKTKTFLSGLKKLACLIIVLSMMLGIFGFISIAPIKASAEDPITEEYAPTDLNLSNGHFNNSSSSYPATASNWSGEYKAELSGSAIYGIIELTSDAYSKNIDKIKLNQYPEYQNGTIPKTPFGKSENGNLPYIKDSTSSALMINTNGSDTIYGYSSESLSLNPHGFYMISVWAKTGDFSKTSDRADVGAAISLSGFDYDCAFTSVNTVKNSDSLTAENNFGWKEFIFYVATDYRNYSITLDLSVGYADKENQVVEPAKGYALFDTATAYSISPEVFESATASYINEDTKDDNIIVGNREDAKIMIIRCDNSSYLTTDIDGQTVDIGSFKNYRENDRHAVLGWTPVTSVNGEDFSANSAEPPFIFSPKNYSENILSGLDANPFTPFGLTEKGNNILIFNNLKSASNGLQSAPITVRKNQYIKIGFWSKTSNVIEGSAASASLVYVNPTDPKNEIINTNSSINGDPDNTQNYGWAYNAFFVKGSAVRDYDIALQLWLGRNESPLKGIAMFDDVTVEVINYEKYNDYSENFTAVDLSSDYTVDSDDVPNGDFIFAGDYDEFSYPLPPRNWSAGSDITENLIAGLLPKDDRSVWEDKKIPYPANFDNIVEPLGNALVISSEKPVSFGYTSDAINLTTDTTTEITVRMQTYNNAKAYIIAKYNGEQIASISGVSSDKKFTDYKLYFKNDDSTRSITIEIKLGTDSNKSSGTLIVEKVSSASAAEDFDIAQSKIDSFTNDSISVYDFDDIFACDSSSYSNTLMTPYAWSYTKGTHAEATENGVRYGILYLNNTKDYLPNDFNVDNTKDFLFFAEHTTPNSSSFKLNKSITLSANIFYEITVTAKIDIPLDYLANHKDTVGLGIKLSGTSYSYNNVIDSRTKSTDKADPNSTASLKDNNFKTYSFYVAVGETDAPSSSIELTFGGNGKKSEFVQGKFYIADVAVNEIQESDYNSYINDLVEYNETNHDQTAFGMKVDLNEETENPDEENPDEENPDEENPDENIEDLNNGSNLYWYVLPSVLFAVFLLLALLAVVIRRFYDKHNNRKHKEKANSYDRDNTLHIDLNDDNSEFSKTKNVDKYESFDEEISVSDLTKDEPVSEEISEQPETSDNTVNNESDEVTENTEETTQPIDEVASDKPDESNTDSQSTEDFND